MSNSGKFTIVWQGPGDDGDDIFCRGYNSDGNAVGDEFIVNSITAADQVEPTIAMGADGEFIVVWISEDVPEPNMKAVCGQSYDSNGNTIGGEIRINDQNSVCRYPTAAINDNNEAVVVWVKHTSTPSVWIRHFDLDGTEPNKTLSKKVNESPHYSSLTEPDICMDDEGNYFIAWDGDPNYSSEDSIYVRSYHKSHVEWHGQYEINTGTMNYCQNPAICYIGDGEFVVLWEGDSGIGWKEKDIYGQRLRIDFEWPGEPNLVGGNFPVNNYLVGTQRHVEAVSIGSGKFVTGWQSYGQDSSRDGVFAKFGPIVGQADISGDGFVDLCDYSLLAFDWLDVGAGLAGDIVNNGKVNMEDILEIVDRWLEFRYDSNEVDMGGEPIINLVDFAILAGDWRKTGLIKGDIDNDGIVGYSDLGWLVLHWCKSGE
jgi:hypothetical protein